MEGAGSRMQVQGGRRMEEEGAGSREQGAESRNMEGYEGRVGTRM